MPDHPILDSMPGWPSVTPRTILEHDVVREIEAYRQRQHSGNAWWLHLPSLHAALVSGSARPCPRDLPMPGIDPAQARRAAAEALADGIVLMFIDGVRVMDLDQPVTLHAASRVRYIRLHAQRGI